MRLNFSNVLYGYVVMTLYLIAGIITLAKFWFYQDKPNSTMLIFGIAVIIYGIFRGYRAYKAYQTQKNEKDEVE